MRKNTVFLSILALLVAAVFVYGITQLLILRYEAGDIYPPYSSLRTDPLGAKALYEGIDNVQGFTAERNYQPLVKLKEVSATTIFYVGMEILEFLWMDKEVAQTLENLVIQGNRVIISFVPVYKEPAKKNAPPDKTYFESLLSVEGRWGVKFGYMGLPIGKDHKYQAIQALSQGEAPLPATVSWHTSLYFDTSVGEGWKVIYAASRQPVMIEKAMGKGTIVLAADSYFLSNEAMRNERHPELLAWLIGPNAEVVFDETHFGVLESPGIASLIRKYRLGWFVAGLVVLAVLFVWKNALSFVPPSEDALPENGRPGKDVTSGLMNLLRQNISAREIVPVCFEEWQKSVTHDRKEFGNTLEKIQAVIQAEKARPARERDPVKCYQTISKILGER